MVNHERECPTCGNNFILLQGGRDHVRAKRCVCQTPCPLCDNIGFTFKEDETGYQIAKPCRCQELDRRIDIVGHAHLPGRYAKKTFASFFPSDVTQQNARSVAHRFATEFMPGQAGLMFYGECGVGKTHLMVAILRHLVVTQGIRVRFVEFVHLLADLRAGFGAGNNTNDLMAPLIKVPVLAVDELGKARMTDWAQNVLDELISKRYNAGRTTLFTSNYYPRNKENKPALFERVGERIYSRLQEMCSLHLIKGEDYRKKLADQV